MGLVYILNQLFIYSINMIKVCTFLFFSVISFYGNNMNSLQKCNILEIDAFQYRKLLCAVCDLV